MRGGKQEWGASSAQPSALSSRLDLDVLFALFKFDSLTQKYGMQAESSCSLARLCCMLAGGQREAAAALAHVAVSAASDLCNVRHHRRVLLLCLFAGGRHGLLHSKGLRRGGWLFAWLLRRRREKNEPSEPLTESAREGKKNKGATTAPEATTTRGRSREHTHTHKQVHN